MTSDSSAEADAGHASIDDLDRAIVTLAGRINAATYDLLVLIRRFDERLGWLDWGFESCAEWLHYRCDISRSAAREKVRVAHALKTLPAIGRAFAEGRLSYSKVRALTRVAGRHDEQELLAFALSTTAARVEERCRELRYGSPDSTAGALRAHARRMLQGGGSGTPRHYQVTVHVEEAALRGSAGRSGVPIETVRRIACDSDLVVLVEDRYGEPLSVGRKTRVVPAAIHRALWARDGGCRFPGCGRKRFVEAHHVEHWANGGETSLANLILLCSAHHPLLHEGGFTIEKDYRDRWFFRRPDGRAVPACGYRPKDTTDDGLEAAEDYFEGDASAEASARFRPVALRPD